MVKYAISCLTTQILGHFDLSNCNKKSDHCLLLLDQLLVNSH